MSFRIHECHLESNFVLFYLFIYLICTFYVPVFWVSRSYTCTCLQVALCADTVSGTHLNSAKETTEILNLGNRGHLVIVKTMENTR